jgi:hypothetical protein
MSDLEEYIATFHISCEFPHSTAMLSYIKFERNVSANYKEQLRIAEPPQESKPKQEEDTEFMIKLHQTKVKKKQSLNVEELPEDARQVSFSEVCKGTQFRFGIDVYRVWYDMRRVKQPRRLFTMEEDQQIENLHQLYGENWEKISQLMESRMLEDIYYEYHNRINPHLVTGRWSIRQTLMLIILLEHFGAKRWAIIAQKMLIKSELQVRERYCNLVDPAIGKDIWTFEMEKRLLEVAEEFEFCWKRISLLPIFKNKTDNCVWRKYKSLMMRFTEEEINEMLPNETRYRGLGEKIIKEKRVNDRRKRSAKNKPLPPIYYNQFRPKNTLPGAAQLTKTPSAATTTQAASQVASHSHSPPMGVMVELEEEYFNDFSE